MEPVIIEGQALPVNTRKRNPIKAPVPQTPLEMISTAVSQGAALETIEKLMTLQERYERGEAKKAFTLAMAGFKAEDIRVTKDRENLQYSSRYTSLGNLLDTVTPFLSKHELSASWDIDQTENGRIKVTCLMTHALGHSERVSMVCPPDNSGAKSPIQQIKSSITYAKGVTFESICGLASTDLNLDDDGAGNPSDLKDSSQQQSAPKPPSEPKKMPWNNEQLGEFEILMDKAYTAFGRGGMPEAFNAYRDEWKACRNGTKPPTTVLEALMASVTKYEAAATKVQNQKLGLPA